MYDIYLLNVLPNISTTYTLRATAADVKIRNVYVEVCGSLSHVVLIIDEATTSDSWEYIENIMVFDCDSTVVCGLNSSSASGRLTLRVDKCSGMIGSSTNGGTVLADVVQWIRADGGVAADVYGIEKVQEITCSAGDLTGNVISLGPVEFLQIGGGSIGKSTSPVYIYGVGNNFMIAGGNGGVHANIEIEGNVASLRSYNSDWTGTLFCHSMDDALSNPALRGGIILTGTAVMKANVAILGRYRNYLRAESMDANSIFVIGSSLDDPVYPPSGSGFTAFQFRKNDGLNGNIIVNGLDDGHAWAGSIRVNTDLGGGQPLIDLSPTSTSADEVAPYYKVLSHQLGDGSIGLAPFNFHQFTGPLGTGDIRDCNPYHTEFRAVDICDEPTRVDEVIIDHYGPVHTNGTGPYYRVEFLPAFFDPSTGPQWINVTDQFQVDTTRTSSSPTGNNRKVYIIAKDQENGFNAAGRFRFRPIEDKVRCSNVNGFPNVAYQSSVVSGDLGSTTGTQHHWYQFRVGLLVPDCESSSMLFENDRVNAADLAAWLDNPFEVNMDGRICAQDFALMSDAYDPE